MRLIKRFASYYKPHIWLFILDMTCAFFISASDLVFPMVTRNVINNVIPNKEFNLIYRFAILLAIMYFGRMILEYIVGYYGHVLGVNIEYDMRKDAFAHLQKLSMNYYDNTKTGYIMSRVVNDLNEIAEVAHHGPEDLFLSIIRIIGTFILLLTIDVRLTLVVFTIIPFMFIYMYIYNNKFEVIWKNVRETQAQMNATLEESITGIRVVKSFVREKFEKLKFDNKSSMYKSARSKAVKHIGIFDSSVNFLSNISVVITLAAGGYFISKGLINTGDLVAYIIYISQFLQPLTVLLRFVEQYQQGMAGFRRFVELMDTEPEIADKKGAIELKDVKGNIEFDNVTFSYDNKKEVLSGINLKIKHGETVAIVGPSGAGKTTLLSLIPRFYEIDAGSIKIDGIDIRDVKLSSLRENIGIVQQDVFLFSGTIKENISYGKLDASDEEIINAAKAANAHDFIMELKDGYDTYIGERGVKLSGGQKQRISIARMFLKNPPILILDEATSSLDNKSESIIQQSIDNLSKNRTTLIIAHRLGTIRNAKRIIVLTENGIEEEGTHEELMNRKGVYYNLYNYQQENLTIV
ncbi:MULTISPECIES: ABC transporter ATP-binding protein [Thermoanaerobacterium]|uniref:ABC transporter n=2 Tax=Thermoanaerobacterium TaxID=28895 RepID=W9EE88_9THEO|nr:MULTISPECIES: ABC transporter ATP-binding protein [Thermoanaerobacterium]AFK87254.1 ABC transporter related protein [Thermoanaerobacterium saccharolyticum JW/SL-YS485]ETO38074.1 ABC transporter [Thermoanaerobacterium aotearoense SCUT27]WHE07712.1 ABC transporter ATP-binding protein [Thermoanaerobacterium thermosaccharolyticum]